MWSNQFQQTSKKFNQDREKTPKKCCQGEVSSNSTQPVCGLGFEKSAKAPQVQGYDISRQVHVHSSPSPRHKYLSFQVFVF